jgi:hypothetical protein
MRPHACVHVHPQASIIAARDGTTKEYLLSKSEHPVHSVCGHT